MASNLVDSRTKSQVAYLLAPVLCITGKQDCLITTSNSSSLSLLFFGHALLGIDSNIERLDFIAQIKQFLDTNFCRKFIFRKFTHSLHQFKTLLKQFFH